MWRQRGPRLFVVMEAAGGGELSALVLRAPGRGLREPRARALAAQLVSAVRHMHAQGVVHRDLKMENIMLDTSKQYIKIVDFGLSAVWSGGGLATHCGSLEYAAPELFQDGRRYGPEVDLWSIGVIVYGMVTGRLPFSGGGGGGGRDGGSRPRLRAAIAQGFGRAHRAALAHVSDACQSLVEGLLQPRVELRLGAGAAGRHAWLRRPGLALRAHPLPPLPPPAQDEIYKQISELVGSSAAEVAAAWRADPYGPTGGMVNLAARARQLAAAPELWAPTLHEPRPPSPPAYQPRPTPANGSARPLKSTPPRTAVLQSLTTKPMTSLGDRGAGEGAGRRAGGLASTAVPTRGALQASVIAAAARAQTGLPIRRTSVGNIASPHSSTNSHCRSEKAMPVGWYSTRGGSTRDPPLLQRIRRTAPMK
ncbi:unnamed protein product [Plutella xylostella]|uniref:(diamondback moth) hypothetical protein n=1 Tax=Plutella xylostella TaxID=51655 RepID=A0A8S4G9W5_PLUXY|nr:unnamed protein product [Plutella xylostella]